MLNVIKAFLATILAISICNLSSYAMTPEECCKVHDDAEAPGTCTVFGNCAVLTTNLGTEEYKLCGEGGCGLIDDPNQCNQ